VILYDGSDRRAICTDCGDAQGIVGTNSRSLLRAVELVTEPRSARPL
jgi:hypothetical protein